MNYREQTILGETKQWRRAKQIQLFNYLGEIPSVSFTEEEVTELADGKRFFKEVGMLHKSVPPESLATAFDVLDPVTGQSTGVQMTYGQVYAAIYSLYFALATERDQAQQPQQPQAPQE